MPDSEDPIEDPLFHKLFRIYSYFSEYHEGQLLQEKEAHFILDELLREADRPNTSSSIACSTSETVGFRELLGLIDVIFPERKVLDPLVGRLFERLVSQIIKKGFLLVRSPPARGCLPSSSSSPRWIPTWCTLTPGTIHLQPLHKKMLIEKRRTMTLERDARVIMDEGIEESTPEGVFPWTVISGNEEYAFAHFDLLQREAFMRDMQLIICRPSRSAMTEHDLRRAELNDGRAEREHAMRVALEAENKRLAQIVESERRALKDEEIVRGLATRMLEEEKEKNEQMEKLLAELQVRLAEKHHHHPHGHTSHHHPPLIQQLTEDDDTLPPPPREHGRMRETDEKGMREYVRRRDGREADDEMETGDEDIWRSDTMQISATSI